MTDHKLKWQTIKLKWQTTRTCHTYYQHYQMPPPPVNDNFFPHVKDIQCKTTLSLYAQCMELTIVLQVHRLRHLLVSRACARPAAGQICRHRARSRRSMPTTRNKNFVASRSSPRHWAKVRPTRERASSVLNHATRSLHNAWLAQNERLKHRVLARRPRSQRRLVLHVALPLPPFWYFHTGLVLCLLANLQQSL